MSRRLSGLSDVDARYGELAASVDDAYYALEEVASTVRDDMDSALFDSDALERIEDRLALIASLRRKYGDPLVTGEFLRELQRELEELAGSEELQNELNEKAQALRETLYKRCVRLSELRRAAAKRFEMLVMQRHDLAWKMPALRCGFRTCRASDAEFTSNGFDTAEFVSTNRGEPSRSARWRRAGVSRIMLALKTIAADRGGIPTVFDEIDTISGRIAQVVASRRDIARPPGGVRHAPAAGASMADKHLIENPATKPHTRLSALTANARSRGGRRQQRRLHAAEMLQHTSNRQFKQKLRIFHRIFTAPLVTLSLSRVAKRLER